MTQPRGTSVAARLRRSPRVLCLSAALLCALGVLGALSGSLAHPTTAAHHRAVAAVALAGVQDGSGASHSRTDSAAVPATAAVLAGPRSTVVSAAGSGRTAPVDVDSVRTRGPPEPA
jgi:hypothetical protein